MPSGGGPIVPGARAWQAQFGIAASGGFCPALQVDANVRAPTSVLSLRDLFHKPQLGSAAAWQRRSLPARRRNRGAGERAAPGRQLLPWRRPASHPPVRRVEGLAPGTASSLSAAEAGTLATIGRCPASIKATAPASKHGLAVAAGRGPLGPPRLSAAAVTGATSRLAWAAVERQGAAAAASQQRRNRPAIHCSARPALPPRPSFCPPNPASAPSAGAAAASGAMRDSEWQLATALLPTAAASTLRSCTAGPSPPRDTCREAGKRWAALPPAGGW